MSFFIGFGDFNRKYIYILGAICFKLISQLILGLGYSVLNPIIIFKNQLNLSPINYFTSFFLFSFIIGFIGFKLKNEEKEEYIDENYEKSSKISKRTNSISQFHFQNKKEIKKDLIIIGLFFVYIEIFDQYFYSNSYGGLDYWMFEIIFLSFFMRKFFKKRNLLHQKISLYICVFSSFILKLISSFLVSREINSNENSKYINIYKSVIEKKSHWIFIFIFILLFQLMNLSRAFANTKVKLLLDFLYINPFKILLTYGVYGTIFCAIYISFTFLLKEKINFLGDVTSCFEDENVFLTLLYTFLYGIFNSLKILFDIIIIKELSPFHMFAKYKIYYLLIQIILLFNGLQDEIYTKFYIVEVTSDIICFFGFLIYLELIELRCKGLNYELKKSIINRSIKENNLKIFEEKNDELKVYNDLDTCFVLDKSNVEKNLY